MLTDRQVVLMRQKLMKGKTQQAAAAASDMSVNGGAIMSHEGGSTA